MDQFKTNLWANRQTDKQLTGRQTYTVGDYSKWGPTYVKIILVAADNTSVCRVHNDHFLLL